MKMRQELYNSIKTDIQTVMDYTGIRTTKGVFEAKLMWSLLDKVNFDRTQPDTHPAFVKGIVPRILPFDGREGCFFYDEAFLGRRNGLNDSHVETALRKISEELGIQE